METSDFYAVLGHRIQSRRKELGIVTVKLAQKLNISQQQFNRYERGVSKISLHHLIELSELSELLDAPVEWFLSGKAEASEHPHEPHIQMRSNQFRAETVLLNGKQFI
ncbi:helix-turn-helix domain-containing protein [Morganella morganii]|uniref:helix-turn-helix domain-containing protein n=1 Tax=Morganella morganii TaxID=582 RepID=UPI0002917C3A|nr:helix-turn-helix transcriptional regulator [Morganella morganii]HDU8652432.1 helix-turn-helix transcriptional regulator [Morganella morganii subsp. morganii]AVK35582.1 helix-turn-helix domain protein [Morganella morganii]ELO7537485.1 helix-turn-helix transcriptional regulator [Morganella morganii]EMP51060.1 MrfJ protein [Morganella morganii SC01]MBC4004025.1 helix-turn-helix transcriptional regulator [Morganella morganii]